MKHLLISEVITAVISKCTYASQYAWTIFIDVNYGKNNSVISSSDIVLGYHRLRGGVCVCLSGGGRGGGEGGEKRFIRTVERFINDRNIFYDGLRKP